MTPLPIDAMLPEILAAIRSAGNLVLVAEPGAGKTTRVPPAILNANLLADHPNLVVLQPRRVAARAVAARIADENGWDLGRQVGYHVRFDRKLTHATRLRVLTEGILTRQLLDDPFLETIGGVVLDEFHERSLVTDVAVALLREVQTTVRPDLKLIVMSATLDAGPIAKFLDDCPVVRAPGRTFPVEVSYAPDSSPVPQRVASAVGLALDESDGDVLAFLPGADDIHRAAKLLRRNDVATFPLHGSLTVAEQNAALRPADRRKVVLATNIAETSLTIDGIRTVVDSGLAKVAGYDPDRGIDRLDLLPISKASATQRAGRAGRTAAGRCVRLWSESDHHRRPDFDAPEIERVDLAGTVLSLHAWGKPDVRGFGWFQAPPEESVAAAERLLAMLGALRDGRITPVGRRMSQMPVHPRVGRLLLAAREMGLGEDGATLAALISEQDIVPRDRDRRGPGVSSDSDLTYRMTLLAEAERARFADRLYDRGIDPIAARQVARVRDDLRRSAPSPGTPGEGRREGASSDGSRRKSESSAVRNHPHPNPLPEYRERGPESWLPLLAYPDRVCRRRQSDPNTAVMVGGRGVKLAAESTVRTGDFFVAVDVRHDPYSYKSESVVRTAAAVDVERITATFPDSVRTERGAEYDTDKGRVVGFVRTWYRDLLLDDRPVGAVDPDVAVKALADALSPRAAELFGADEESVNLLARVDLLRRVDPGHEWPLFDDAELKSAFADHCTGKRSLDDVKRNLSDALAARLIYPLDRLLSTEAPETMAVPTGNRLKLQYAIGQPPVLAVRLQELFGWTTTPTVAGGKVKVRLHLLGPNYRPVQVTDDLANFWATTYFQVRKDLRARYPKHAWPEDPLTASAVARGRPTKR